MQKTLSVIDLRALRDNARFIRRLIGDRFFYAVVKADAYGHGGAEVALALEDIADGFCVALAEEGIALRLRGVRKPVLVLTPPLSVRDAEKIAFYGLTGTVASEESAVLLRGCECNIAVNTGMNRYGCNLDELEKVLNKVNGQDIRGVFSHLYSAEDEERAFGQLKLFRIAAQKVKERNPSAIAHLAASGGTLRGGEMLCDGVRCGLLLYGYAPQPFTCADVKPVLKVYARQAQSTRFCGGGVGYNVADEEYGELYTYRLGYADGFFRNVSLGEKTLCMDAFISKQNRKLLPVMCDAAAYAKRCGTIPYEVLCSVTRRSERIYINGE